MAPASDAHKAAEAGMKALESAPALENRAHLQSCRGRRVGDEIDDDLVADQWLAAPALCDVAEHAVLDLIRIISAGQTVSPQAPRARVTVSVSP